MAGEMEKNATCVASVVMNEEHEGREEIRQDASKGRGKSKDIWGLLDKRISEMETSLETLRSG